MMRQLLIATVLGLGLLLVAPGQSNADILQTYDLAWSGTPFGNSANATGTITLDLSLINNPGETDQNIVPFVTNFSITVTGASSGNGTFGFSDYIGSPTLDGFYIITDRPGVTPLDFSRQLVGQPTGFGPWGALGGNGSNGDFNIFPNGSVPSAPDGTFYFTITTNGVSGDSLGLTSFAPVPEPSTLILGGIAALAGVALARRRHRMA
jgi:PEP-CTERM motif